LLKRRFLASHANVRSTIQVRPRITSGSNWRHLSLQHFQLLNRLATGGPNNQYFQLHHRTLAERKVDRRARLPASRNSHGMAEDQLAALARGQA